MSKKFRSSSVLILIAIAASLFAMSACAGRGEPASTPVTTILPAVPHPGARYGHPGTCYGHQRAVWATIHA